MSTQEGVWVALILALFLTLGMAYSLVAPPFETPDEPFHYAFARHLAQGNGLPVQGIDEDAPWSHEGSQAPLYYALVATLIWPIDQGDFDAIGVRNRRANMGDPLYPGNKNIMLYSAADHPVRGANLALHVGRWFSLLLGAVTLLGAFFTARLAAPADRRLPLLAMLFVALIPQFLFVSAAFSNDSMVIAVSVVTVYWLARLLVRSQKHAPRGWEWLVLGGLLGVAALSKLQGLGVSVLAGCTALWMAWQRREPLLLLRATLLAALPALLIGGWWYARNMLLYGDLLGATHLLDINGRRTDPLTWGGLWRELRGVRYSFWGLFGWFNIALPRWMYGLFELITVLGVGGLLLGSLDALWPALLGQKSLRSTLRRLVRRPEIQVRGLLVAWTLLLFALFIYWISQATSSQGRLLFPGLSAIGILLVLGLDMVLRFLSTSIPPRRLRSLGWTLIFTFMGGCSLYVLTVLLPASYAAPEPIARVPDDAQRVDVIYGNPARAQDELMLLALDVGDDRYRPGETVPVTLYLRADAPVRADYQLFIQFLDEAGNPVANLTTHPGWGRNPTSLWQPGAIYADSYPVRITERIGPQSPLLARVYVGFINPASDNAERLPVDAYNAAGEEIVPLLTTVEISPLHPVDPAEMELERASVQFGPAIQLTGFALPPVVASDAITMPVTLLWEAVDRPAAEYVGYIHLLDERGARVAGFDQPPAVRFPTQHWQAGDRILSEFVVDLPPDLAPGMHAAWVGLYAADSAGAERVPVHSAGELETAHNQVRLGAVEVRNPRVSESR